MDLNICLYCEKSMTDSTSSFCSNVCRNQESKQDTAGGGLPMLRSNSLHSLNSPSPPPYEMAYHRRQSFSYNSPIRRSSNSTSSSSLNSLSFSSFDSVKYLSMSDTLSYPLYTTP
ncbi:hypothetical protein BC941DRAFT_429821 [Chlamydoabsidia padenii]|nr:hypothetical protein BC941DRAFT_429821 [Chlamydoabsidia padenii]